MNIRTRTVLFILWAAAIIANAEVLAIINTVSPSVSGVEVFWTFFICLFVGLTSITTLLWYGIKKWFIYKFQLPSLGSSARQAALLCSVIVLSLFFNSLGILSPWEILPLLAAAMLIEFYFQADKNRLTPSHEPE